MAEPHKINLSSLIIAFRSLPTMLVTVKNARLSTSTKVVLSVTAGFALLGVLARYLRRRKRTFGNGYKSLTSRQLKGFPSPVPSPNGDILTGRHSASPALRSLHRQGSVMSFSDRLSVASGSIAGVTSAADLTPQQLGLMGMEALETSINYWEDAMAAYDHASSKGLALTDEQEAEFAKELQKLLDCAYKLQDQGELLFIDQRSVLFRAGSSARGAGSEANFSLGEYSSPDSFVSAQDEVADLREFEEFANILTDIEKLPLYQSALRQLDDSGIPYRNLRTELLHCSSDVEYLAKLHCVRLAFQWLFRDQKNYTWVADAGRQILTDLLLYADKDPKDFLVAYEEMLLFLQKRTSWQDMEDELSVKGVKALTFYDVVMDYILMDAFEDLETPPSSVLAVVQNRWLSNGFKETALTTAVWSVLKAKRRKLKFSDGFMAHFYAISEQMSPLMAWGFLGPDNDLKEICNHFKEQVLELLQDVFSFQKSRYSSVEELSEDIMGHIKLRVENISCKLQNHIKDAI
ncbi:mitoguardin [Bemisia tabaci]|uniref:mitoguardin n=1 Tax=Bemisia tabaci TaxID=7038 RepID=UPI003B27C8C7